jgi:uncharacterized membrane protein
MDPIEQRLHLMEQRLESLEKKIANLTSSVSPTPNSKVELIHTSSWEELEPKTPAEEYSPHPQDEMLARAMKSGNWLGIIAIICFIFAAGFIIKLSVESGWLTPTRQIIIAACFGMALIISGFILRENYRAYASLLPAAGVIILYLSVFAQYRIYELTAFSTALILTNLVSLLCIWLYWLFRHDVYAIVAVIGAYTSPLLLDMQFSSNFTFYYYVCCSLSFATISIWTSSRIMSIVAAYLAILCSFVVDWTYNHDSMTAFVLAVHFIIFSLSTYLYSVWHKVHLTETESWAFFPVLILFYGIEYFLISNVHPTLASYLSLLFAALLIGLYLLAKRYLPQQEIRSQGMIYSFASVVFFHSVYIELIPYEVKPWLFALIVLSFAFLSHDNLEKGKNKVFYLPIIMVALIALIEYLSIVSQLFLNQYTYSTSLAGFAAFFSIWIAIRCHYTGLYKQEECGILFLAAAHLIAIIGLYRLADPLGSLAVTSFWLVYAIIVLGFAYYCRDKLMAHSALLVLGLAAGKALLYDAAMTPTAVRILCLLFTGVVLYGAGLLMKNIAQWDATKK